MAEPRRNPAPELVRAADPFAAAAERLAEAVERIAAERGRARLAVSGGSAAVAARRAAELLDLGSFDFARLALTWIDERCVPASSPESNRGTLAFEPPAGLELPLWEDGETVEGALARVRRALAEGFDDALDVVLLGMGADGHVASIFPGRPSLEGLVAHVAASPKPPDERITLTRALLATARCTVLAAAGEGKRAALERLLAGDPTLPATGLPGLVVCTDLHLRREA